jgi:putative sigma-54 modulation protein
MDIKILSRNVVLTGAQSETLERRVQFALGRFATEVRTVQLTLTDVNGPKGGSDVLCRVKVALKGTGDVNVSGTDVSVEVVVASVVDRAARSLSRMLDRQRDHQGTSMSGQLDR